MPLGVNNLTFNKREPVFQQVDIHAGSKPGGLGQLHRLSHCGQCRRDGHVELADEGRRRVRSAAVGRQRRGARGGRSVFKGGGVIRSGRPVRGTPLLARQQCAHLLSGNCPIRVDSRFCRAHPYRGKSRHCY
jgi:hypothetical protein